MSNILNNFWVIFAPVAFLLIIGITLFCREQLRMVPVAIRKGYCGIVAGTSAIALLIMLHAESHRGLMQVLRNQMHDIQGQYDIENALTASAIFCAVTTLYAWLVYVATNRIAQPRVAAQPHTTSAMPNDNESTKDTATSDSFDRPILVLNESTAYSLGSVSMSLAPGEQRIYDADCVQRYVGSYGVSDRELWKLLMQLPYELRGKVEITDLPTPEAAES